MAFETDLDSYFNNKHIITSDLNALALFNQLLNNDVQIAGSKWQSVEFNTIADQYRSLLSKANDPFFDHIVKELNQFLLPARHAFGAFMDKSKILKELKEKQHIIFQAGTNREPLLVEMIDTGKSTQILIYNTAEGIEGQGSPKRAGNKSKFPAVYSFTAKASLSHITELEIDNYLYNYHYSFSKNKKVLQKYHCVQAFRGFLDMFSHGVSKDAKSYYKNLIQPFTTYQFSCKQHHFDHLDVWVTPTRSAGNIIKTWFSGFQRFRAALSKLSPKKQKAYYAGKTIPSLNTPYSVARLQLKCKTELFTIQQQLKNNVLYTVENAFDHHDMIQNLFDAIKKLPDNEAVFLQSEKVLLEKINQELVQYLISQKTSEKRVEMVGVNAPISGHVRYDRQYLYAADLNYESDFKYPDCTPVSLETLSDYQAFLTILNHKRSAVATTDQVSFQHLLNNYAKRLPENAPDSVVTQEQKIDWIACQFSIMEAIKHFAEKRHDTTRLEYTIILQKAYLNIFKTLQTIPGLQGFKVDNLFHFDRFHVENFVGFLTSPLLRKISKANTEQVDGRLNGLHDSENSDNVFHAMIDFSKSLGLDLVDFFDFYASEKKLKLHFKNLGRFDFQKKKIFKSQSAIDILTDSQHENDTLIERYAAKTGKKKEDFFSAARLISLFFRCSEGFLDLEKKSNGMIEVKGMPAAPSLIGRSISSQHGLPNQFSCLVRSNSKPYSIDGETARDNKIDYESNDLYLLDNVNQITEFEWSFLRRIKRAYRSPAFRWSEGISILQGLLPNLQRTPPHLMKAALSLIGTDDIPLTDEKVIHSRQKTLLNLLEQSDRFLSEPQIDPYYFTYASLLQWFLIHHHAEVIDLAWCQERLKTYQKKIADILAKPEDYSPQLINSAIAYQSLDIYRRLIILKDESSFEKDYDFFIKHMPDGCFKQANQTIHSYYHPDVAGILTELQQFWVKSWANEARRATMLSVISDVKGSPLLPRHRTSDDKYQEFYYQDQLSGESKLFSPWLNKTENRDFVPSPIPPALLDSVWGDYLRETKPNFVMANDYSVLLPIENGELIIPINQADHSIELKYQSKTYHRHRYFPKTYLDDHYVSFVDEEDKSQLILDGTILVDELKRELLILDKKTLKISYIGDAVAKQLKKPNGSANHFPLSSFTLTERWSRNFLTPHYVEATVDEQSAQNQVSNLKCLQTGLQFEYREPHWICLQKPKLHIRDCQISMKVPGFQSYLGLFDTTETLKQLLVPRTAIELHGDSLKQRSAVSNYGGMTYSTFDYDNGRLHGQTMQDKLHLFYLYSLYGTEKEQSDALQEILSGGAIDLQEVDTQHLIYLIFYAAPADTTQRITPHLAALKLKLFMRVFAKFIYNQKEIDTSSLKEAAFLSDSDKENIKLSLSNDSIIENFNLLRFYYFDVEHNLPHDQRLIDSEKSVLMHLSRLPYFNTHPFPTVSHGTEGKLIPGPADFSERYADWMRISPYFFDLFPGYPADMMVDEPTAQALPFLQEMQDAKWLVDVQQNGNDLWMQALSQGDDAMLRLQERTNTLRLRQQTDIQSLEKEIFKDWWRLQQLLGKKVFEQLSEQRQDFTFDIHDLIRRFFIGEIQAFYHKNATTTESKAVVQQLQDKLIRYLLQSILLRRMQELSSLCEQFHYHAETSTDKSDNQGIIRKIVSVLMEKQDPEIAKDLRFLMIGFVLGFCLTNRQIVAIQDALKTGDARQILEAEMGFGKSEVVLPALALMQDNKLPVLVLPKQLIGLTENAIAKTVGYFGYTINRIGYRREENRNWQYFAFLCEKLETATAQHQVIVTDQATLQALKLSYIEKCNDPEADPRAIYYLSQILIYLKNHVRADQDEFHEQTVDKQFNYAEGKKINIPSVIQDTLLSTYCMMTESDALSIYLHDPNLLINEQNQNKLVQSLHHAYVTDPNSPLSSLSLNVLEKASLEQWFRDEIDTPDWVNAHEHSQCLHTCKYFANQVVINNLKKKKDENFGRNPTYGARFESMIPIPYLFNQVPALGSEFANPIQLTALTIQLALLSSIPRDVFDNYLKEKRAYYQELRLRGKTDKEIESDAQIKSLINLGLFDALKKHQYDKVFFDEIYLKYQNHDALKKMMLSQCILPAIRLHDRYLNDTHQGFLTQFAHYQGISGTPPKGALPFKAIKNEEISKGVFLRVAQLLLRKKSSIFTADTPKITLSNYFEVTAGAIADKLDRFRVIFDLDNDFQGFDGYHVAKTIQQWIQNRNAKALNAIKVIVFFEADKAYYIHAQDPSAKKHPIQDIKNLQQELSLGHMNEAFVYFDQAHCVGVNMPLAPNVFALANMGPRVPISLYQQMIYRLRALEGEQNVTTILDRTKTSITSATEVPETVLSTLQVQPETKQLVQLLYHAYQVMAKDDQMSAPIAAEETLKALLRDSVLEQSYQRKKRSLLTKTQALFYVDLDIQNMLQRANALKKPLPKAQYYDAMLTRYRQLFLQYSSYPRQKVEQILAEVRKQYEPFTAPEITLSADTMDATVEAQHQVQVEEQIEQEQMHQRQVQWKVSMPRPFVTNPFKSLKSNFSPRRFDKANQYFYQFQPDASLFVTENHNRYQASLREAIYTALRKKETRMIWANFLFIFAAWALGMTGLTWAFFPVWIGISILIPALVGTIATLFMGGMQGVRSFLHRNNPYQDKSYHKPFSNILVIRKGDKLYSVACTIEDVRHLLEASDGIKLPYMLYQVDTKSIISSNDDTLCHWLTASPAEVGKDVENYRRLHAMRQQCRFLNGDLFSLLIEEKDWFFADPHNKKQMQQLWHAYETEILPYRSGKPTITKEMLEDTLKNKIAHLPKQAADYWKISLGRRSGRWIWQKCLQLSTWVYHKIQDGILALYHRVLRCVQWFVRKAKPNALLTPTRLDRISLAGMLEPESPMPMLMRKMGVKGRMPNDSYQMDEKFNLKAQI